jgi:hypothetical protein
MKTGYWVENDDECSSRQRNTHRESQPSTHALRGEAIENDARESAAPSDADSPSQTIRIRRTQAPGSNQAANPPRTQRTATQSSATSRAKRAATSQVARGTTKKQKIQIQSESDGSDDDSDDDGLKFRLHRKR